MKNKFSKKSPAQQRAILNNGCLRSLGGMKAQFELAGHHDFAKKAESLDADFRAKLERTK